MTCSGWEVVCPDGRVRHYPFHNEDDAQAAADRAALRGCRPSPDPSDLVTSQPPCPNGSHEVRCLAAMHGHVRGRS
jgi:hypothetical protein